MQTFWASFPFPISSRYPEKMTNPSFRSLIVAFFLSILVASPSVCTGSGVGGSGSSSDVPFVVAQKKASLKSLKTGTERVLVSLDIYNQGFSTAYDVSLVDDSWSEDVFEVVTGNISHSWERLDAGGILSHSFELETKEKGMFFGAPAVITFRVPTKAALQVSYSTPILPLDILVERPPEKKFKWAKRLLAKYGSLISVISIVVLFVYLVATPSKSAAKGSKKKR